jgi:hypothetical protein
MRAYIPHTHPSPPRTAAPTGVSTMCACYGLRGMRGRGSERVSSNGSGAGTKTAGLPASPAAQAV